VREHLARRIAASDARRGMTRAVHCQPAPAMTHRQLIALHRRAIGDEPRRRTRTSSARPPGLRLNCQAGSGRDHHGSRQTDRRLPDKP
jgi:hypothetical protein